MIWPFKKKPEFFVGQIRAARGPLVTRPVFLPSVSGGPVQQGYTAAYYTTRYEQWNGTEWLPIGVTTPTDTGGR
jgi:hypothetical protein